MKKDIDKWVMASAVSVRSKYKYLKTKSYNSQEQSKQQRNTEELQLDLNQMENYVEEGSNEGGMKVIEAAIGITHLQASTTYQLELLRKVIFNMVLTLSKHL